MKKACIVCHKVFYSIENSRYCKECWDYYFNVIKTLEESLENNITGSTSKMVIKWYPFSELNQKEQKK